MERIRKDMKNNTQIAEPKARFRVGVDVGGTHINDWLPLFAIASRPIRQLAWLNPYSLAVPIETTIRIVYWGHYGAFSDDSCARLRRSRRSLPGLK